MNNLLTTILFMILFYPAAEWDLKKDKSGVEVYTRSPEGSSFDEFKAVTIIENSDLYEVLDIIFDVENYDKLFADCMNPKTLKEDGKWYNIHYIQTKAPFPVKDRDSVFELVTTIDENEKHALVKLNPLPDYIPEKDNLVRIRNGKGFWELQEENNSVTVIYQFHGDPGGDVPAWLANSFVVSHPYKTMLNLKNRIKTN